MRGFVPELRLRTSCTQSDAFASEQKSRGFLLLECYGFGGSLRGRPGATPELQVYDVWFRPLFAFFVIDIKSREVVHVAATRAPTQGIHQRIPIPSETEKYINGATVSFLPVLGGLHHDYQVAA